MKFPPALIICWLQFIMLLTALTVPAAAQQGKAVRVAVVGAPEEPRFSEVVAGLRTGLHGLGYGEQAVVIVEGKITRADEKHALSVFRNLLRQNPQVFFLIGSRLLEPLREMSKGVPAVFITPGDPVGAGLLKSWSRPGGNTTAITFEFPELSGKRLELLKEIAPPIRRVLAVYDPRDPSPRQGMEAARLAAQNLGLTLNERQARSAEEFHRALKALDHNEAYLSVPGGLPTGYYDEIIRLTNTKRIPAIFHARMGSTMDALASYGASDAQVAQDAARLVDKIVQGANAGELPVERPSRLDFVISLNTAKQIGLTIPPNVLARADRVIR